MSEVVVENQAYDNVLIKLYGSRHLTTRNRRFLKKINAPVVQVVEDVMPRACSPEVVASERFPHKVAAILCKYSRFFRIHLDAS